MNFVFVFGLISGLTMSNQNFLEYKKFSKPRSDFDIFYSKLKKGFVVIDNPCLYPTKNSKFCGYYRDIDRDRNKEFLITFIIKF